MAKIRSLARLNLSSVAGHGERRVPLFRTLHISPQRRSFLLFWRVARIWLTLIVLLSSPLWRRPSVADDRRHVPPPVSKRRSATLPWPK
jgi:hypothetical protein